MLQGMHELGLGVVDEVASDAQCKCAVCICSLQKLRPWALETPWGILSLARHCQHRNTHGRQKHAKPEACMRGSSVWV